MPDCQDIVLGVGSQALYLEVPEGRPSSVTSVKVLRWNAGDDATGELATTGSPSVDSVSTTFDAASGVSQADPKRLNLTATTGIVIGRQYLATAANGERESVEVEGVVSADYVLTRVPVANDYAAADTFVSTRISIAVLDAWAASLHNLSDGTDPNPAYRVLWVYVVAGVVCRRYTGLDLVRAAGSHNVRGIDVERMVPGFLRALPLDHREDGGRALIDEAYAQVAIDLHQEWLPDQQARNQDIVDELTKRMTVVLWAEARAMLGGDPGAVEVARTAYRTRFDQLIRNPSRPKIPFDVDNSGAGARVAALGIGRR